MTRRVAHATRARNERARHRFGARVSRGLGCTSARPEGLVMAVDRGSATVVQGSSGRAASSALFRCPVSRVVRAALLTAVGATTDASVA
jgi:hypothetical protein